MHSITPDSVFAFARTLRGQVLPTATGRAEFTVDVHADALWFTPESSQKERKHERRHLAAVCAHYNATGSLKPADYQDITRNSSYVLALISMMSKPT